MLEIPHQPARDRDPHIRTVNNIPAYLVYPIRGIYLEAINRAKNHVYITTAYFIPDKQILRALLAASKRGVDVRLIQPEDSNHVLADWLSRRFYTSLRREGVTILLYRNAMIHAKAATIDGRWSTIETANIDRLRLTGNYETNLEIHDQGFAADMEKIFEIDSTNCRELTLSDWKERHFAAPTISATILIPLRPFLWYVARTDRICKETCERGQDRGIRSNVRIVCPPAWQYTIDGAFEWTTTIYSLDSTDMPTMAVCLDRLRRCPCRASPSDA